MAELKYNLNRNSGEPSCSSEFADNTAMEGGDDQDLLERPPVTFEDCERYERALGLSLAESLRRRFGSHERLPELLDLADSYDGTSWLFTLGELWLDFDNLGIYRDDVLEEVRARVEDIETILPELMNPDEQTVFEALPDELVIYRGCGPHNVRGFSWSLEREVAAKFPFPNRCHTEVPILLTARIHKSRAAALKLGRNEHEIIVLDHPEDPSLRWTGEFLDLPKDVRF